MADTVSGSIILSSLATRASVCGSPLFFTKFKRCRKVVETETAHFKGAKYNGIYSSRFRVEKVLT